MPQNQSSQGGQMTEVGEHHAALTACANDPNCQGAIEQIKAKCQAIGVDWQGFLKTALTAFLQILPGLLAGGGSTPSPTPPATSSGPRK